MGSLASEVVQAACSPGDRGCESGAWMALFRAAESSAGMFSGIAVSMNLFSAHEGHVLVMNSRMSLSLGNAFSRKPGSRARGGLKAGRPTDGRQAGRAQALEPGCEASRARQRCDESRESGARQHFWPKKLSGRPHQSVQCAAIPRPLRVCVFRDCQRYRVCETRTSRYSAH